MRRGEEENEEEEEEEEDQSELRIHHRWRNTPSRPTFPPHKSLHAFFSQPEAPA